MDFKEQAHYDMAKSLEKRGEYEKALSWYRKIENDAETYECIGEYLYFGKGCEENKEEAKAYFLKAANLGNVEAMCNYALCVSDPMEKIRFYKMAAEQNNAYAMNMVGIIIEEFHVEGEGTPLEWFQKSALAGDEAGIRNHEIWSQCD